MESWAAGGVYRVTVHRETKNGAGYRKIKEYGGTSGKRAGILWMKKRVYAVMCEKERGERGGEAREESIRRRIQKGPPHLGSKKKCFSNALRHTLVVLEMQ